MRRVILSLELKAGQTDLKDHIMTDSRGVLEWMANTPGLVMLLVQLFDRLARVDGPQHPSREGFHFFNILR